MKKSFLLLSTLVLMALSMQSCLTRLVNDTKKILEEEQEVLGGDIFKIASATVTYSDGTTFAFKDYGRYQYIEDEYNIEIITPKVAYECYKEDKTYYTKSIDLEETGYYSEYVFMEESWKAVSHWDNYDSESEIHSTKMTICGKTCDVYIDEDDDAEGGWKRIVLYRRDYGEELKATSLKETADNKLFEAPEGYTEEEY